MATTAQCKTAIDRFGDELAAKPNVVGIGIVPDESAGAEGKRRSAVAVYVTAKVSDDELKDDERVPPVLTIRGRGKQVARVPIRVIEQGPVQLESSVPETP